MNKLRNLVVKWSYELNEFKPKFSDDEFRRLIGVSVVDYEKKLGSLAIAIANRPIVFKSDLDFSLSISTNSYSKNYNNENVLYGSKSNLFYQKANTKNLYNHAYLPGYSSIACCSLPYDMLFEPYIDESSFDIPSSFNSLILHIQEVYGTLWEEVYDEVVKFRNIFKILTKVEKILLGELKNAYLNSKARHIKFEYFDLIFTDHPTVNNSSHGIIRGSSLSIKRLNHYETKSFKGNT